MNLTMLLLTIATVILAGLSFWAAVHYGRKALSEARDANALASERSVVEWHVERWDEDNPGHFYAVNSGQDAAHEVTLLAWDGLDRVEVSIGVLRAAEYDRHPIDGPAEFYIEFTLAQRESRGARPVPGPPPRVPIPDPPPGSFGGWFNETRRQQDEMIAEEIARRERQQVWVRISWRSELGRWSTQELQTG